MARGDEPVPEGVLEYLVQGDVVIATTLGVFPAAASLPTHAFAASLVAEAMLFQPHNVHHQLASLASTATPSRGDAGSIGVN